jgi:hypothetical protein
MPALASEFDVLAETTPSAYYLDDASVLSKSTRSDLNKRLSYLEVGVGLVCTKPTNWCLWVGRWS